MKWKAIFVLMLAATCGACSIHPEGPMTFSGVVTSPAPSTQPVFPPASDVGTVQDETSPVPAVSPLASPTGAPALGQTLPGQVSESPTGTPAQPTTPDTAQGSQGPQHGHSPHSHGEAEGHGPHDVDVRDLSGEGDDEHGPAEKRVRMLFYHEPNGCPHCMYEMPQVSAFQKAHPEVEVVWRNAGSSLSPKEEELLSETSGHPIMVFYSGEHRMVIQGETSAAELEANYKKFVQDTAAASRGNNTVNEMTGSGRICH